MLSLGLFADGGKPAGSLLDRPEFIYATAGLAGALLLGAVVVYLVDRWRKQSLLRDRQTGGELAGFRTMFERGEITEEEYARLRQKVAARVKHPAVPATPTGGPGPAAAGTPAPAGPSPGPAVTGPLPPGYFDDPDLTDPPPGGAPPARPPGGSPPPA
ncbi:MAG: hypothetical protein JWO38_2686 [Gemmataceae bacterium]|nr:hypothetical protein [Gemmataceae bacterium]